MAACSANLDGAWLCELAQTDDGCKVEAALASVSAAVGKPLTDEATARAFDDRFGQLPSHQRKEFLVPTCGGLVRATMADAAQDSVYLVGNSLGLQPRKLRQYINEELDAWERLGVNGHFDHSRAWMPIDELVLKGTADVVGALESEVAVMNSLTVNLHLLFVSFYRPKGARMRILYEADAFGSDYYAFMSQAQLHGFKPEDVLVPLRAREGEVLLRTEDIVAKIEELGSTLATVCFGTVQYYTGQFFEVEVITKAAQAVGATALWDCAHAAGNVHLKLHDWGVDGACWCSYKYLNAGPGGIGGFFVHEKHHGSDLPILRGWWGQQKCTRFHMAHEHRPEVGASAWRMSNPPVLQTVSLLASLEVFGKSSQAERRGRSLLLTGYLLHLVKDAALATDCRLKVITPEDSRHRGAQLSLQFAPATSVAVFEALEKRGVVVDHRKPDVIRVAPAPLYNTFLDVFRFASMLRDALVEVSA